MAKGGNGNIEALNRWATESAGGEAHFAWGTPGDFQRCVTFHEGKGLSPEVAKGHCANLHHRALGVWPGHEHKKGEASTMDTAHGYVPILKYDKQPDGSLIVEGIATDSGLDRDEQICDPGWLSKAMPAWFKSGGNIREQHDPRKAAGVAIQYEAKAEGHHIRAHVIDSETVKKVEGKVLKGFSFGARGGRVVVDKAAKGGRIVDGDIYEVSLVDRPANPRCLLTIAKADGAGDLQVVDAPELVEKADDEPRFTPTQFAELLKGLGKTPAPVPTVTPEKRVTGVFRPLADTPDPAAAVALLSKADGAQVHDANDIAAVRDGLIALIKAELTELASGQNELMDVSDLLQALRMVMYWWQKEARGGETDNPFDPNREAAAMANIELADGAKAADGKDQAPAADTTKTDAPVGTGDKKPAKTPPPAEPEGAENAGAESEEDDDADDTSKTISKSDVASLIQDAITKAVQPYEERLKTLGDELAEVKATPIPGGPARTRTPGQAAITQKADGLRAQVDHLQKAVTASSGVLQAGYRERLEAAQAELRTLEGSTTS